jgi:hypothetical protein
MAWLRNERGSDDRAGPGDGNGADDEADDLPDMRVINYWLNRMRPLLGTPAVLVVCNRIGTEKGAPPWRARCRSLLTARALATCGAGRLRTGSTFAGSSCVIDLDSRTLLGALSRSQPGLLVVET